MFLLLIFLLFTTTILNCKAWTFRPGHQCYYRTVEDIVTPQLHANRRDFVATITITTIISAAVPLSVDVKRANAVEDMDPKDRFVAARKDLRDLIENYTEISSKGGDAVRSKLGTQGLKSNLFGIQKILKILIADAEDIVEYTESMNEFNAYYYQAEGAAYQSMFIEHSSAKGTPESLLKTAKTDILKMEKYMDELAVQLKF